jgi:hypothetical protein
MAQPVVQAGQEAPGEGHLGGYPQPEAVLEQSLGMALLYLTYPIRFDRVRPT